MNNCLIIDSIEHEMDDLSDEELEMTLECAYNVKRNLKNQLVKNWSDIFLEKLRVIDLMIETYESAYVKTLAY